MKKVFSILVVCCMLLSTIATANAETIYKDVPFNGQGNSKIFLTYGDSDLDYVDFVDYSSSYGINDGVIEDGYSYIPFAICLSPNGIIGDSSLVLDTKGNWNLYGIPFKLATDEKVIKLLGITENRSSMSEIEKAVIDNMRTFQLTTEPKSYSRIYFLAYNSWTIANVKVTVTYSDNTTEEKLLPINASPYEIEWSWPARDRYNLGYTVTKSAKGTSTISSTNGRKFYPYTITVDPNKEVIRLDFNMGAGDRFVNIISITGVEPDTEDLVEYASIFAEITKENYTDAKLYVKQSLAFGVTEDKIKTLSDKVKAYEEANGVEDTEETVETPEETTVVKAEMQFEDLDDVMWAYDAVKYLYDNDIVSGTSDKTFSPHDCLTREQVVKIICEAFDIPDADTTVSFKDVKKGSWYEGYVKNACGAGLISGVSKDKFGVGEKITKQDLAVILYRTVGSKIKAEGKNVEFTDRKEIDGYAVEAISTLARAGILTGSNGKVNPKAQCTRAEMAKIVYGVISNISEGVQQ